MGAPGSWTQLRCSPPPPPPPHAHTLQHHPVPPPPFDPAARTLTPSPPPRSYPFYTHVALDVITECACGEAAGALAAEGASPYVQAVYGTLELTFARVLSPWLWPDLVFWKLSPTGRAARRLLTTLHTHTQARRGCSAPPPAPPVALPPLCTPSISPSVHPPPTWLPVAALAPPPLTWAPVASPASLPWAPCLLVGWRW